jgi:hypothetical protein
MRRTLSSLFPLLAVAVAVAVALASTAGCSDLAPGEWGNFRYFGQLAGEPPMRLIPPLTDRDGNVYVLHGRDANPTNGDFTGGTVYVGHHLGGWSAGCYVHKGEDPDEVVHGFVGRAQNRAWFWSGIALAKVSGETGSCSQIIAYDQVSQAELDVIGVVPWVEETPSRTTLIALVESHSDSNPYIVVIDLDQDQYTDYREYDPDGASDIVVVGTGASTRFKRGYVVMSYATGGGQVSEALVLDKYGATVGTVPLNLGQEVEEYSVQGFLQVSDGGLVAGLMDSGQLLVFNESSGGLQTIDNFAPVGMLLHEGQLWVTGTSSGDPVIARLDDAGNLGSPQTFSTAKAAASALDRGVMVVDERSDPSHERQWDDVYSAISSHPMLTPHPVDHYTLDSIGWVVAGPGYSGPIEDMTAVAFAPVGVSIP